MIIVNVVDGATYYETEARGVRYTAREGVGRWEVFTQRLALGRHHMGGVKIFATVADVVANVRALAGLDLLLRDVQTVAMH